MTSIAKVFDDLIGHPPHDYQERVIQPVLNGENVFAVLSTGAGKSMCFQAPASVNEGLTVVISPLISLMKDQVDSCKKMGIRAARITHDVSQERVSKIYRNLHRFRILYIAPERLKNAKFLRTVRARADLKLIALDEVHEHSKSGRDFRPAYSLVSNLLEMFPDVPVLALTATADEDVEREFVRTLNGRPYQRVVASPNRPNLHYRVTQEVSPRRLSEELLPPIVEAKDAAIVYCSTRALCDSVSQLIRNRGVNAIPYHGGLRGAERHENQELWMNGEVNTIVATNAFGMGVNKPNVRLVFHYTQPGSVFSYLQEAGRAGRDGEDAYCYLNLSSAGERTQRYFIDVQNPDYRLYTFIWEFLRENAKRGRRTNASFQKIAREARLHRSMQDQVISAVRFMEYHGDLTTTEGSRRYRLRVLNTALAREYADRYRFIRLENRLMRLTVPTSENDPVPAMVEDGAVFYAPPMQIVRFERLRRDLTVTEESVVEKKRQAEERLIQVRDFAAAEDKQAFIENVFLKRQQETVEVL